MRRGWAWVLAGVPTLFGGRAGGHPGQSCFSWPCGCRGRVISRVPAGAPDVGRLVQGVHLCGSGFDGGDQRGVRKGRSAPLGPQLCGVRGGMSGRGVH